MDTQLMKYIADVHLVNGLTAYAQSGDLVMDIHGRLSITPCDTDREDFLQKHFLYITVPKDLPDYDWYLSKDNFPFKKTVAPFDVINETKGVIIATAGNEDLINEGVQRINRDFLELYVKAYKAKNRIIKVKLPDYCTPYIHSFIYESDRTIETNFKYIDVYKLVTPDGREIQLELGEDIEYFFLNNISAEKFQAFLWKLINRFGQTNDSIDEDTKGHMYRLLNWLFTEGIRKANY